MIASELKKRVLTGAALVVAAAVLLAAAQLFCVGQLVLIGVGAVLVLRAAYEGANLIEHHFNVSLVASDSVQGAEAVGSSVSESAVPERAPIYRSIGWFLILGLAPIAVILTIIRPNLCNALTVVGPHLAVFFAALAIAAVFGTGAALARSVAREFNSQQTLVEIAIFLILLLLVSTGGTALLTLVLFPNGPLWIVFLVTVVALTDSAAYFGGKRFGRTKLAPNISPKKTWSGALIGALTGVVIGAVVGALAFGWGEYPELILYALLITLTAQLGDLLKSLIKRARSVKDCGKLLPGHGGALDRLDGILAGALILFPILLLKYFPFF